MKLDKKKMLASRVLGVGKNKIIFDISKLSDIKEAITNQDIRDLFSQGIIKIRDKRGKKKIVKRKTKKGPGKRKKRVKKRKQEYVKITRRLRNYIFELKKQGKINYEEYRRLRKEIKAGIFKNKSQLKESLEIK